MLWALVQSSTYANQLNHAPITITASKQHVYLQENKVVFTGDVKIIQGKMTIYADKLLVQNDAQTTQKVITAYGTPARYFHTINGKLANAKANEIIYLTGTQILKFKGHAQINQNHSVVQSSLITYNQPQAEIVAETSKGTPQPVVVIFNASHSELKIP
jgi:lipopolysaccharide export system protein LptA